MFGKIFGLIVGAVFLILLAILFGAVFFDGLRMEREKRATLMEREDERISLIKKVAILETDISYLEDHIESLERRCHNE